MIKSKSGSPGEIYLMRHAQTNLNLKRVWQCWQDEPLNDQGVHQAIESRETVAKIRPDVILTSDFLRARQTAEIISEHLQLSVIADSRLRERRCDSIQGLTHDQILERFGIDMKNILSQEIDTLPGVEKIEDFMQRVNTTVDSLSLEWSGKRILAVTHGGFVRSFYEEHIPPGYKKTIFANCSITGYIKHEDIWELRFLHIPEE